MNALKSFQAISQINDGF